jgi:hypothetical protein
MEGVGDMDDSPEWAAILIALRSAGYFVRCHKARGR